MPTPEARLATILDHATAADPSGVLLYFHTPAEAETFLADYTRCAAQRGAEADRLVRLFARVIVEGDGAFTGREWEAALCEAERINRGAPPQTGGGDALREAVCSLIIQYDRCSLADFVSALELEMQAVRSAYGSISGDLLITPKSPQTGGGDAGERARERASAVLYRVTEHLAKTGEWAEEDIDALRAGLAMLDSREAALRSSHREGAEAMREDCVAEVRLWVANTGGRDTGLLKGLLRALPIPGKTDAG